MKSRHDVFVLQIMITNFSAILLKARCGRMQCGFLGFNV